MKNHEGIKEGNEIYINIYIFENSRNSAKLPISKCLSTNIGLMYRVKCCITQTCRRGCIGVLGADCVFYLFKVMECVRQFPEVVATVGQVGVEWIRLPWGGISMDGSLHQGWQKREESIHRWAAHIIYRGHQGPYHTMIFLAPFPLGHHSSPPHLFLNEGIEMPRDFASHSVNIFTLTRVLVLQSPCAESFMAIFKCLDQVNFFSRMA